MIKDKGLQKRWLLEQGFPSLPHRLLGGHGIDGDSLAEEFGLPLVQKTRCGGYDGLGVQIIEDRAQLAQLWQVPSVIEAFVPECREIAVLLARGKDGEVAVYPPLGMAFDEGFNALSTVVTPADIPSTLAEEAVTLAKDIVQRLGEVGVFAVEMFIDRDDRLFVNEISPRVHNSGHLTMEANSASQFEQHVRAVTGLPLAAIGDQRPAAMVNILYSEGLRESCPAAATDDHLPEESVTLHWYGKEPGRIGRKMGHITALAETPRASAERALAQLAKLAEQAEKKRKEDTAAA
jgi:5-(carboxyamino)imidazole ribonucleotide synthase